MTANGGANSCAVRSSGQAVCWGDNYEGRLGDGTSIERRLEPGDVTGVDDATAISAGGSHGCALRASGRIACWGSNRNGQLGDGTTITRSVALDVVGLSDAVQVTAGLDHTCARRASDHVVCWGSNLHNRLGTPPGTEWRAPTEVVLHPGD